VCFRTVVPLQESEGFDVGARQRSTARWWSHVRRQSGSASVEVTMHREAPNVDADREATPHVAMHLTSQCNAHQGHDIVSTVRWYEVFLHSPSRAPVGHCARPNISTALSPCSCVSSASGSSSLMKQHREESSQQEWRCQRGRHNPLTLMSKSDPMALEPDFYHRQKTLKL
jgi:hypothetical protein